VAEVRLAVSVRDALQELPADTRDRVKQKLRDAGDRPDWHLKQLSTRDDYRIRIGDYRAIVDWDRQRTSCMSRSSATGGTSKTDEQPAVPSPGTITPSVGSRVRADQFDENE
jgi:mRNA interferase RelE/StbE